MVIVPIAIFSNLFNKFLRKYHKILLFQNFKSIKTLILNSLPQIIQLILTTKLFLHNFNYQKPK